MKQYLQLLDDILTHGRTKSDRTGHGTRSLFGPQMQFDLSDGFPLVTTRKIFTRGMIEELLWFLRGEINNESLREKNVHFWTPWALKEDHYKQVLLEPYERVDICANMSGKDKNEFLRELNKLGLDEGHKYLDDLYIPRMKPVKVASKGDLGPVYGAMWRSWPNPDGTTLDQITTLIDNLQKRPYSRRHIVSGWNPSLLPEEGKSHEENILNGKQCLPPCHTLFQFMVEPLTTDERLNYFGTPPEKIAALFDGIVVDNPEQAIIQYLDSQNVPTNRLSCKLHQR